MDFKILSRRAVSLCLCLCLVGFSVVPRAEATGAEGVGSLTIAAGALSTGGLTGSALVSAVAPYVVPVVAIALAGFGINAYVTEQSKQAGMTRSDYVKDTIDHFCSVSSYGAAKFYSTVAKGITVGPTGKIQLSHAASKAISQMIEWMFTQDGMVVETPSSTEASGMVGNYKALQLSNGTTSVFYQNVPGNHYRTYNYSMVISGASAPVYACYQFYKVADETKFSYALCSTASFSCVGNFVLTNSTQTSNYNVYYSTTFGLYILSDFFYTNIDRDNSTSSISVPYNNYEIQASDFFNAFLQHGYTDSVTVPGQDCFTGDDTNYLENKDVLNPTIDNVVTTLNPDVLNKILDSLGSVATDYTMSIADYLDALTKAYDQALEDVKTGLATLTDVVTGIKEQIAIPDTAAADPSIAAEDTGTFDPAVDDSEPNVPDISEQFQYPLKTLFPFCIPFDLFALYSVFDAEPVAPRVEINYTFPIGNGIPIHVVLDLSPWNSVAATLRAMVLVAFVAGLAVRTRRIFIQA